ncbi:PaaI family thioesterase [Pseudomonas sp. 14P_8.1_Bac3]|uniref:PaaI family thioesterase n=1 Tax=Pseudomonas sp. 14P_8.1_Bac3 TaxID=2971621 RepID=UPI0021C8E807|nr:PaaI family thioesterase [Pseudomonas sp. 14P_8.1_Bac3]MCU1763057.1 PaaI family thioesterase [Pseudomonas sp. 14P_8.1_Bac3]
MSSLNGSVTIPEGFTALEKRSGFLRNCGEFFVHDEQPILAVRLQAHHLNYVHIAHGGFLATVADSAFGVILRRQSKSQTVALTVNLNIDYIGPVREGDWLEAHVEVLKNGGTFINASCLLKVGARLVLRANGVFTTWKGKTPCT